MASDDADCTNTGLPEVVSTPTHLPVTAYSDKTPVRCEVRNVDLLLDAVRVLPGKRVGPQTTTPIRRKRDHTAPAPPARPVRRRRRGGGWAGGGCGPGPVAGWGRDGGVGSHQEEPGGAGARHDDEAGEEVEAEEATLSWGSEVAGVVIRTDADDKSSGAVVSYNFL